MNEINNCRCGAVAKCHHHEGHGAITCTACPICVIGKDTDDTPGSLVVAWNALSEPVPVKLHRMEETPEGAPWPTVLIYERLGHMGHISALGCRVSDGWLTNNRILRPTQYDQYRWAYLPSVDWEARDAD
jgi:hypothetical protein